MTGMRPHDPAMNPTVQRSGAPGTVPPDTSNIRKTFSGGLTFSNGLAFRYSRYAKPADSGSGAADTVKVGGTVYRRAQPLFGVAAYADFSGNGPAVCFSRNRGTHHFYLGYQYTMSDGESYVAAWLESLTAPDIDRIGGTYPYFHEIVRSFESFLCATVGRTDSFENGLSLARRELTHPYTEPSVAGIIQYRSNLLFKFSIYPLLFGDGCLRMRFTSYGRLGMDDDPVQSLNPDVRFKPGVPMQHVNALIPVWLQSLTEFDIARIVISQLPVETAVRSFLQFADQPTV